MTYHPDKNKDDIEAAEKFREITGAYEVLGNFRLRKLYDKGMIHTAGEKFENVRHEKTAMEEDDPTTRFYKARMKKEHTTATGRTPIYDFDVRSSEVFRIQQLTVSCFQEWTSQHYGGEMKRRQQIKTDARMREMHIERNAGVARIEVLLLTIMVLLIILTLSQKSHDVDRLGDKKKAEVKKEN